MTKLNIVNGLVVETGEIEVFNHVDPDDKMWAENGGRSVFRTVYLKEKFATAPMVHAGICLLDGSKGANMRIAIKVSNIKSDEFSAGVITWDDTRLARVSVNWIAIGTAK